MMFYWMDPHLGVYEQYKLEMEGRIKDKILGVGIWR